MINVPKNYYDILGVKPSATQEEINTSYKFLVKAFHPDRYTRDIDKQFAESKMKDINAAYSVLSNVDKRKAYDLENAIRQDTQETEEPTPNVYHDDTDIDFELKEKLDYLISIDKKWRVRIEKLPDMPVAQTYFSEIMSISNFIVASPYINQGYKFYELRDSIVSSFTFMMFLAISLGIEKREHGLSAKFNEEDLLSVTSSFCLYLFIDLIESAIRPRSIPDGMKNASYSKLSNACINTVQYCFHLVAPKVEIVSTKKTHTSDQSDKTPPSSTESNFSTPKQSTQSNWYDNGCGIKVLFAIIAIVLFIIMLGFCNGSFSRTHTTRPTQAPTRKINTPIPTNTKQLIFPTITPTISPTSTPSCFKWDQITIADKGKKRCVYGTVRETYFGGNDLFYIRFGPKNSDFRLLVQGGYYYEGIVGKCVLVEGVVKTYYDMPYIEVYDNLKKCNFSN